jgi:hypothetical protein
MPHTTRDTGSLAVLAACQSGRHTDGLWVIESLLDTTEDEGGSGGNCSAWLGTADCFDQHESFSTDHASKHRTSPLHHLHQTLHRPKPTKQQ